MVKKNKKAKNKTKEQIPSNDLVTRLPCKLPMFAAWIVVPVWIYVVFDNYFLKYAFAPLQTFETVFSTKDLPAADWGLIFKTQAGHILNILFVLVFWISVFGWGNLILKKEEYSSENNLFRIALGSAVTSLFIFVIGVSGLLYKVPVTLFLLGGFTLGFSKALECVKRVSLKTFSFREKIFIALLSYPFILGIIGALSPETFYDSAVYHLGVPQSWINNHNTYPISSVHMSFYPFNIQLLYTIGLMLRDEMASKLIHFSFTIFNIFAVFALLKKYFSRTVAWLGVVIFWCTPFALAVSWKTAVEMGIGFFEVMAFFAYVNYFASKERKWLVLSAVMCGLGLGSKYTSVYAAVSLVIVMIVSRLFYEKEDLKPVLKDVLIFTGIASLVFSPWLIRNLIAVKNPVFPLLWEKLGTINLRSLGYLSDPPRRLFTLKNIIMLPWEYAMGSKNIQEPFCGAVYILTIPLFILFKRKNRIIDLFVYYFFVYYFLWQYLQAHFRLFVPALPVICGIFAYWIGNIPSKPLKNIMIWSVAVLTFSNVQLASTIQKFSENPLGVFLGRVSRVQFLGDGKGVGSYVSPNYRALKWVNENLPDDSYLLFIGETRGLYCERRFLANTVSEYVPIVEWIKESGSETEFHKLLKEKGFTHILINIREVYRLKSYNLYYWQDEGWKKYNKYFDNYLREIYSSDWVYVYEIMDEPLPASSLLKRNFLKEIYLSR